MDVTPRAPTLYPLVRSKFSSAFFKTRIDS